MSLRRTAAALALAAALAPVLPACSSDPGAAPAGRTVPTDRTDSPRGSAMTSETQSWTGFAHTDGLEVVAIDENTGMDRMVRLALRGPAADVDKALAAAAFTADFRPGVKVFEPSLAGVDLASLTEPSSAEDTWDNAEGRHLTRKVVRGTVGGGGDTDLLHVWAFTT